MNIFRFQDDFYLQKQGTAMGTRMAPSYANLFMGLFETNFLSSQPLQPLAWMRFIDDVFFIWQHSIESLETFLNDLNSFSSLKFTWTFSKEIITFLDVDVFLESGFLKTKLHLKSTNTMQYLHYNSCHPSYVKKSVPKSLAFRGKSLCSKETDFQDYIRKLNNAFTTRSYPKKILKNQLNSSKFQKPKIDTSADPKFITTFYPGLHRINNIIRTAFPILQASESTKNLFARSPRIVFKKPKTLKNMLVRPKLPMSTETNSTHNSGSRPCKKPRCGTCSIIKDTSHFTSKQTNKKYNIKEEIDCNSENVIYQLNCRTCEKQYIGQTSNPLRIRMTGHRFSVSHKEMEKPIASHAEFHNKEKFEDCYELVGIKQLSKHNNEKINRMRLKRTESAHQMVLQTKKPIGLNIR
jgi:hypothetical protein